LADPIVDKFTVGNSLVYLENGATYKLKRLVFDKAGINESLSNNTLPNAYSLMIYDGYRMAYLVGKYAFHSFSLLKIGPHHPLTVPL